MTVSLKEGIFEVKKILIYVLVAVVTGVLTVMVPVITLVEVKSGLTVRESFQGLDASYMLGTTRSDVSDLTVLVIGFAVALSAYLLTRRKIRGQYHPWVRIPPC